MISKDSIKITITIDKESKESFDKAKETFGSYSRFVIWMFFKTKKLIFNDEMELKGIAKRVYIRKQKKREYLHSLERIEQLLDYADNKEFRDLKTYSGELICIYRHNPKLAQKKILKNLKGELQKITDNDVKQEVRKFIRIVRTDFLHLVGIYDTFEEEKRMFPTRMKNIKFGNYPLVYKK